MISWAAFRNKSSALPVAKLGATCQGSTPVRGGGGGKSQPPGQRKEEGRPTPYSIQRGCWWAWRRHRQLDVPAASLSMETRGEEGTRRWEPQPIKGFAGATEVHRGSSAGGEGGTGGRRVGRKAPVRREMS